MKPQFDPYAFEKLEVTGVPLFYKNLPWVNDCVHIRVIMRVGARHDPVGKEGLAHFFEHLPFDGCAGYPTLKEVEKFKRKKLLGCLGAYTWYDETVYHCDTLSENMRSAFGFLKEFIFHPLLDPEEVERERKVITREFWDHFQNQNLANLRKTCFRDCFHDHRIGRGGRALGWPETIAAITHEDIVTFHRERYVKENVTLVCVGSVYKNDLQNAVEGWGDSIPNGEKLPLVEAEKEWPHPSTQSRSVSYQHDFYARGGAIPKNTDITITSVIPHQYTEGVGALLQRTFRHILFEKIRGELGATYTPCVFWHAYGDICHAVIEIKIQPDVAERVMGMCGEIMSRLGTQKDAYRSLFEETKQVALDQIRAFDKNGDKILNDVRDDIVLYGRIMTLAEKKAECERVMYEDICALAERAFHPDHVHFCVIRP